MTDPRYKKLAELLVTYSTALKKGDHILLEMIDVPDEFAIELMRAARRRGAIPLIEARHTRLTREMMLQTTRAPRPVGARRRVVAHETDAGLHRRPRRRTTSAKAPMSPSGQMSLYTKTMRPVQDYRVNKTRWCVLRWPSPSMAQAANMSTEAFENFYFEVCTMDYPKMARAMIPLQKLMNRTDRVHLKAPGTDLQFSIKGIGALVADGRRNIPDGEVFSCPIKNSVQGCIQYNTPTHLFRHEI